MTSAFPAAPDTPRDTPVRPFVIAALAFGVALLTVAPWPVGVFQDDAIYVVLAKALAEGDGFRMISMPGAPHATHFPPGYPLVLAVLWKLYPDFPDNIVLFKFANALFLALAAYGTYVFSRSRLALGATGASITAVIGTMSVVILVVSGAVMSEPLYMALLLPTLLLAERAAEDGDLTDGLVAGALIGVLAIVRTVGVFALPAALVVLVARRRWRAAAGLALAAGAFIVPWQLWVSAYQGETPGPLMGKYGAYGPWLLDGYRAGGLAFAKAVLAKNADVLFGFLGYAALPVSPVMPRFVSLATLLVTMGVAAFTLRRRVPVTLLFLAIYGGVILLWPFEPMRFALVWWPVLAGLFVAGVRTVWQWRPAPVARSAVRFAVIGCVVLVSAGYGWYNVRGVRERWWANIQRDIATRAKPIAEWVASATRDDDVVIADDDLVVYLYTGRRALPAGTFTAMSHIAPLTPRQDADAMRSLVERYRPKWYVVATQPTIASAQLLAEDEPPRLRFSGSVGAVRVYEPLTR